VAEDIANYDNGDFYNRNSEDNRNFRKIVRISILSTLSQHFIEKLKSNTVSLSTSNLRNNISVIINTAGKMKLFRSSDILFILDRFRDRIIFNSEKRSDLITIILKFIRFNNFKFRAATKMQLRLKIGLKLDVDITKLQKYEEIIFEFQIKIDELEIVIVNLIE
jgi:hypothetical protein